MSLLCGECRHDFPECGIWSYFATAREPHYKNASAMRKSNSGQNSSELSAAQTAAKTELETDTLQSFFLNSLALCSSPERIEKILETMKANKTNGAFVTYADEFQHNWAMFAQIMERHPDWKIANNFASQDKFGLQAQAYIFSEGLHRRYRNRVEGRFKTLLSSGIYGLWSKWQRIKFSMSGLRYDEKKLEATNGSPGDPLSFENSEISWLFLAHCLMSLGAFVVFGVEQVLNIIVKKFKLLWAAAFGLISCISHCLVSFQRSCFVHFARLVTAASMHLCNVLSKITTIFKCGK